MQNVWTPSKVIARLGKEINDESSYLYWAYKVSCLLYYLCIVRSQKRTAEMGT
jgi:deoxyhypusine synthase